MNCFTKYRKALRALRAECPTELPVRVRLVHEPRDCYGWTARTAHGITIYLCTRYTTGRRLNGGELRDTIIHEWAHALVSRPCLDGAGFHDALWGVAYAQAYQAAIED